MCGRVFDITEWIPEAYSSENLRPRLSFALAGGEVWEASRGGAEFFIGSNPGENGLKKNIPSWKEKHVRVFKAGSEWNICGNEGEFSIDGKRFGVGASVMLSPGMSVKIGNSVLKTAIRYTIAKDRNAPAFGNKTISQHLRLSGNEVVAIGSKYQCGLHIDGSESVHAKIYRNRKSGEWWIVSCCASAGTFVNGIAVHNEKLIDGDCIGIAGTRFIFSSDSLSPFVFSGFSVDVENASSVRGGRKILDGVNLHVREGEFVGVLGPSGCGKSSLIQRIVGLDSFDSGVLKINGCEFQKCEDDVLAGTAYLPQQIALHEDLTVAEEAKAFCCLRKLDARKFSKALSLVGLSGENGTRIGDLSGGQRRRLGIALELLRKPQLLVLDEPTSGLDPKTETEMMTYLRRIASQGKTVICSTHILGNLNLFDKVLLMARGRVVFYGTPRSLLSAFGVKNSYELYGKLDDSRSVDYFAKKAQETISASSARAVKIRKTELRASAFSGASGYLLRMFYEFVSFRNSKNKIFGFLQSAFFIQMIVQPALVATAIKFSCAYKMTTDGGLKEVLFFCAVSVFWLGLNNTVRELVRERVPQRCLERMEQISAGSYLFAKVLWSIALCFVQILLFVIFVYVVPNVYVEDSGSREIAFSWGIFGVLLCVGATGAVLGLAISAFFRRETAAVSLLPIVLIPVLFFSQPIVRNDGNAERCSPVAAAIAAAMPCHEPQMLMHEIESRNVGGTVSSGTLFRATRNTALYVLFALGLMVFFQNRREREWNGR